MQKLKSFVENSIFKNFILVVIIFNCVLMGLQTSTNIMNFCGSVINLIDQICFYIFVVELILKLIVYNKNFCKDGWNIFDFFIVLVSFLADFSAFSAFRAFRIFRVFRSLRSLRALKSLKSLKLVSGLKHLRIIVSALAAALPSIVWTALLLLLVFYIFALIGTTVFGEVFVDWFGTLGRSLYTLFQVMTMESWSMGISRPVMEVFPWAWCYFIPFILCTTYIVLNVVVGIVVSAIQDVKSEDKKRQKILDSDHSIIIGFNDSIYSILYELVVANENVAESTILVLCNENTDSEIVSQKIEDRISHKKGTKIICRSGNFASENVFAEASLENSKSVIINLDSDFETIKEIISITKYIKKCKSKNEEFHIVALIKENKNVEAAKIAGGELIDVLYCNEAISRILAHSCRYPGLSKVFGEIFSFDGNEIYYESFENLNGKTLQEIALLFNDSSVMGFVKNGIPLLNPPMDTIYDYSAGDKVIHLADDDNSSFPNTQNRQIDISAVLNKSNSHKADFPKKMLVIGYNEIIHDVIEEYEKYVPEGSVVTVITDKEIDSSLSTKNVSVNTENIDIGKFGELEKLVERNFDVILLACNNDVISDDSQIVNSVIKISHLIKTKNLTTELITQMQLAENQELISDFGVCDFVIGSDLTCRILAQLSENRNLLPLYQNLLDESGSKLFMKPVTDYVQVGIPVDFYQIQKIAGERGELVIGYKKFFGCDFKIVTSPKKDEKITFTDRGYIIVVAVE